MTKETIPLMLKDYLEGMSIKDLKTKYKAGVDTINKHLINSGIKKSKKIDWSKFKTLNELETQYWLGYICADGNIQYNTVKRVYKVSLFSKDEEVILAFKSYFGNIVHLHYRPTGLIEAYINSKELCEYFINDLNIIPNKGLVLNPNLDYTNHFILGYFDGDGCIVNSIKNRVRYEAKITCGSKVFINKIAEVLKNEGIYYTIRNKGNAFDLCIDRKDESKLFYKFLYRGYNGYCLSRKLNNFVALFGNLEIKIG